MRDAALARSLGDAAAILMRGHGITVVGAEVRLHSEALRLGAFVRLNAHEARRASKVNNSQMERAWERWKSER